MLGDGCRQFPSAVPQLASLPRKSYINSHSTCPFGHSTRDPFGAIRSSTARLRVRIRQPSPLESKGQVPPAGKQVIPEITTMATSRKAPRKPSKASVKAAADRAEKRAKGEEIDSTKVEIDPIITTAAEVASAPKAKMGRPTKYRKEYARIALALCKRGATDYELAQEFEVSTMTICRWGVQFEEFRDALRTGKDAFDDRVERALAQRAMGYSHHTEKVFQFQGQIVRAKVVEHVPPDVGAAKLWLTNRRGDVWRDLQKHEVGQPGDFAEMDDAALDEFIRAEGANLLPVASRSKH